LKNEDIIKEAEGGYALWNYVEPTSLWDNLQDRFKQVGGDLVGIVIEKASYVGRDEETGWRLFRYDSKSSIKGIMVLKAAPRFVATASSVGIHFRDEYDGILLTSDLVEWKDRLLWKKKLYEVRDVDDRLDGYDSVGYRIGGFVERVITRADGKASSPVRIVDARGQVRDFLVACLGDDNITIDDGDTKAPYCVMYMNPDYPIIKEFQASQDPVDGIYAVDISEAVPSLNSDHEIYGYTEHVPISIYTTDKVGVTGTRLQSKMESELMRACEKNLINQCHVRLERRSYTQRRLGSIIVYHTEFVLKYWRRADK